MCGIAGIIRKNQPADSQALQKMLGCLKHRGPDDEGQWANANKNVLLGQRRLAIIDLSPGGHQPKSTSDGRYTVTFNGEIYNYRDLRQELIKKGYSFKSDSDTEVLLYSYAEWKEACLDKFNGMFAFALWDEQEQTLFAARDKVGEKPFKYFFNGETFIFASEVKAILSHPDVAREVDWGAVDEALSFRFVPAPATGFTAIKKLPAGHYLVWKEGEIALQQYWYPERIAVDTSLSLAGSKDQLWSIFLDSVRLRLISDVPVGAFLSGGIDSSSIVAALAELKSGPIETFVISMEGESADQRAAALVAKHFGTNHHELALNDIDYATALENVAIQYDEPFFDQSALPSMLINQEIKKHVTVALSGDGGDELFGGYDAYRFARFLKHYHKLPAVLRKKLLPLATSFSSKLQYRAEVLAHDFFTAYTEYFATWKTSLPKSKKYITKTDLYRDDFAARINLQSTSNHMEAWFQGASHDLVNRSMLADFKGRLADGYLPKVDFAAMASAVEVRPPFLDPRLVEMSLRLPSRFKIRGNTTKYIWREIIKSKLPPAILSRPKAGFSIPLHTIVKKQLRPLIEDTILSDSSRLLSRFKRATIHQLWADHLAGRADYSNHLWSLLILELWLKHYNAK